jgi:hypothetical protein
LARELEELRQLERMLEAGADHLRVRVLGTPARDAPAVGFFGGVHGLERIGTQVLLAFLGSLLERLPGDASLESLLSRVRLVFMPLVNPAGMQRGRRSNASGVDLMRNAPLAASERPALLVGGHRLSARLPWYRGRAGAPMEPESRALCELVRAELLAAPFSISLDCHSGYGLRDRVWFPYAHTRAPFIHLAEVHALIDAFATASPAHPYLFEPQSRRYLAHGDLWDYLSASAAAGERMFLPLTLEMGSWRWIRKEPRQLLSRLGMFNPLPRERLERVKRNHVPLLSFLCRAARDHREWLPSGEKRLRHERAALAAWFRQR